MSYLKDREIWLSNVPTGNPPTGYFWKFIQNGKVVVRDSSGNNQIMVATSGSQAITGSLTVTGGITGTVSSASYVEYSNVANKPALVSGSAQIAAFGYATTGSNGFNGSQSITGSLTVTGQVVAQTLNVQQVTSSIVYSSGSNIFGNSLANTQQFTGSVSVTGSLAVAGALSSGTLTINGADNRINSGNELRFYRTDNAIYTRLYDGGNANGFVLDNRNGEGFSFQAAGTNQLRIASTGAATFSSSVGINGSPGTSFPLEAYINSSTAYSSTSRGNVFRVYNSNTGANIFAGIELGGAGSANDGLAGLNAIVTGNGSAALTFYTRDSNTFAEKMRITSGGDVFINNSSGVTLNSLTNKLSISSTTYNLFDISRFSDNAFGPNFYLVKSRNGSIGGNTIVANGDNLGNINWVGANGTGFTDAASIKAEVDGGPGASDMPGRLVFSTTADGATSVTERMRITSGGNIGIGTTSPVGAEANDLVLQINGNSTAAMRSMLRFTNGNSGTTWNNGVFMTLDSTLDFYFYNLENAATIFGTNNTERMRITSGGNIIVGYNQTTTTTIGRTFATAHSSANRGASLFYGIDDGSKGGMLVYNVASSVAGHNSQYITFETHEGAVSAGERMRISSDGNVEVRSAGELRVYRSDNARYGTFYNDNSNVHIAASTDPIRISSIERTEFYVTGVERMRITSTGRTLLIGTTSSSYSDTNRALLELNGLSGGTALLSLRVNDSQRAYFYHNNTDLYIEQMLNPGRIYVISVSGGVYLTAGATSWTANSDERLKNINGEIENAVDKLSQLRAVNFSWKNSAIEKQNLGLIAQDVEKVFPELIDKNKLPSKANQEQQDNTEYLGVRYQELIPVLVKAIQEQQTLIESLKSRIEILEQ